MHGTEHIFSRSDQTDIYWITGNTLSRPRQHRKACESFLVLVVGPSRRKQDVGNNAVANENYCDDNKCDFNL